METIGIIILTIIGLAIAPCIIKAVALAIWQLVEIPYRIVMVVFYASAYLLIAVWEAVVWIAKRLWRIWIWVLRR